MVNHICTYIGVESLRSRRMTFIWAETGFRILEIRVFGGLLTHTDRREPMNPAYILVFQQEHPCVSFFLDFIAKLL